LQHVSLDEYCCLTRRLVTPIYPADANLIVSLLDLHPDASVESDGEESKLEVLEAGTGHGALTLHLSRAIHAANVPRESHDETAPDQDSRRAVIHSVEVSPRFSEHAQQVVKGFRHGLYAKNVDFHVGNVSDWVKEAFKSRGSSPFLSHAFLDLPSADVHMANVAEALRVDGTLVVFNPSITQITECAKHVKEERIPLDLAKVVELGVNGGSGGREWDVRFVRPRSLGKLQAEAPGLPSDTRSSLDSEDEVAASESEERTPTVPTEQRGWSFVCRPKVGERITGGGFLGVWKKTSHSTVAPVDA
jgi:tRNA A58 N-methylase Trm61